MNAKDTKWSWLILAATTFIVFLEIGILKGFSVLLPDLKDQLSSQTWIVGSCISIIVGWGYVLGLSAGVLVERFGSRSCLMMSGLFSSCGLIVCAYATNVHVLLLGLVLCGFLLLQENVAMGIIPEYFEKYYNVAINACCFGTAMGIMTMPLLTQMCLDIYGWRGALLILCGFNLHTIPCGALVIHSQTKSSTNPEEQDLLDEVTQTESDSQQPTFNVLRSVVAAFGLNLFTSLPFNARVTVPSIVHGLTFSSWLIYIVSFAVSNGASIKQSAVVGTCGGIGNAIIRITLPWLNSIMTYRQLLYTSSFVMTISWCLITAFPSVLGMSVASLVFGIGSGIHGTQFYVACKDISNEDQYPKAVALHHLVYGLSSIVGALLTGIMYDTTGSFNVSFVILASISSLTAVSVGLEDMWTGINKKRFIPVGSSIKKTHIFKLTKNK